MVRKYTKGPHDLTLKAAAAEGYRLTEAEVAMLEAVLADADGPNYTQAELMEGMDADHPRVDARDASAQKAEKSLKDVLH